MPTSLRAALAALVLTAGAALADTVTTRPWTVGLAPGTSVTFLSGLELRSREPSFGGFSGLEVSADGSRIVAVSDQGRWLEARLVRREGRLAGLADVRFGLIRDANGEPPRYSYRDAEALAIADAELAGPRLVAFERLHRIGRFDSAEAWEAQAPFPADIEAPQLNSGIEALTHAPDGRLLAVRESASEAVDVFSAWWIAPDGAVTPTEVPRLASGAAVGADIAPDGRLILLTREFSLLGGFRFALWRFEIDGDALTAGEILHAQPSGEGADNAEGVAAWRDSDGRTRVLIITDDNLSLLQRTLLIEAELPD